VEDAQDGFDVRPGVVVVEQRPATAFVASVDGDEPVGVEVVGRQVRDAVGEEGVVDGIVRLVDGDALRVGRVRDVVDHGGVDRIPTGVRRTDHEQVVAVDRHVPDSRHRTVLVVTEDVIRPEADGRVGRVARVDDGESVGRRQEDGRPVADHGFLTPPIWIDLSGSGPVGVSETGVPCPHRPLRMGAAVPSLPGLRPRTRPEE